MPTITKKKAVVGDLKEVFNNGKVAIVADLQGLTVAEMTTFRRALMQDNARLCVGKNTLVKRAIEGTEFQELNSLAKGPSAYVIGYDDPAKPAKSTVEFLKKLKKGEIRGGVFEGKALDAKQIKAIASLPSREVLLSSIMGGLDSGARGIAGVLAAVIRDIAILTEEVAKKNEAK